MLKQTSPLSLSVSLSLYTQSIICLYSSFLPFRRFVDINPERGSKAKKGKVTSKKSCAKKQHHCKPTGFLTSAKTCRLWMELCLDPVSKYIKSKYDYCIVNSIYKIQLPFQPICCSIFLFWLFKFLEKKL